MPKQPIDLSVPAQLQINAQLRADLRDADNLNDDLRRLVLGIIRAYNNAANPHAFAVAFRTKFLPRARELTDDE